MAVFGFLLMQLWHSFLQQKRNETLKTLRIAQMCGGGTVLTDIAITIAIYPKQPF